MHSVLERTDFAAVDLKAEVDAALECEATWRKVDLGKRDEVVAGLCAAIGCPLGPMVDGLRLRDLGRRHRIDELGFELPIVGGSTPIATLRVEALADVLRAVLPEDDPVARYADRLHDPLLSGDLRGYLTGSLDLVFRLPGGRYALADYKTNKLGAGDEALTAWNYRPAAIEAEMANAHYPLQGLLYSVALHRYLRWRLAGYEPAHHLGPVLYLFLRGMSAVRTGR